MWSYLSQFLSATISRTLKSLKTYLILITVSLKDRKRKEKRAYLINFTIRIHETEDGTVRKSFLSDT